MLQPKSAGDRVYRQLREELVTCRVRPGERLLTEPLRTRFGVSFTVVREALARLAAEGFAIADPQRGFTAASISVDDVLALTEARIGVEDLCLRESIMHGTEAWAEIIVARRDAVMRTPVATATEPPRISDDFLMCHDSFHDALVAACRNPWLMKVRDMLFTQSRRYRAICIPLEPTLPHREQGYREITDAVLARDADRAIDLIADRFRRNTAAFVEALECSPMTRFWCDVGGAEPRRASHADLTGAQNC